MPNRPSLDQYWASHLRLTAERATCLRRKTGAIITDSHGACLSMGYNGIPSGIPHCGTPLSPCKGEGAGLAPGTGPRGDSGNESTQCWAVHAEVNAILRCHRLDLAHTLYITNFPCFNCAKMIANTPILRVIALEDYPGDRRGLLLLTNHRRRGHDLMRQRIIRIGDHFWYRGSFAMFREGHVEMVDDIQFFISKAKDSIL